jgi:glycosyltransferase involved in cell wall biosynthesis
VVEDGVDGLLVEPGDIVGLAHALEQLLASSALRAKLSLAAKSKVVERFTPQRIIPTIEGLYRELGISRTTT